MCWRRRSAREPRRDIDVDCISLVYLFPASVRHLMAAHVTLRCNLRGIYWITYDLDAHHTCSNSYDEIQEKRGRGGSTGNTPVCSADTIRTDLLATLAVLRVNKK